MVNSPYFPRTVQEYGDHKAKYLDDIKAEATRKIRNFSAASDAVRSSLDERELKGEEKRRELLKMKVGKLMKPLEFAGTAVLAERSIWGVEVDGATKDVRQESMVWPTREEMKYEGEQRARQGIERRLPLPRENRLKEIDRSEMMNGGAGEEVERMECGEMAIPWRMRKFAGFEAFDRTGLGTQDRVRNSLEPFEEVEKQHASQISDGSALNKGWLGKGSLDEL